jgi:hypothetical protein
MISFSAMFVFAFAIDISKLVHYTEFGDLIDKWHEQSCAPIYDGNLNYIGENCSDDYTIVLMIEGRRIEKLISNSDFKKFRIGDRIEYNYDLGKLNGVYQETFDVVNN